MAPSLQEKLEALEMAMKALIKENKKTSDSNLNEVENKLHRHIIALEARVTNLEQENTALKEEVSALKVEMVAIKNAEKEEGEINDNTLTAIKEEISKEITKDMEGKLEAKQSGWVEVVKKNIRKEVREETQREENQIIHTTIEEEKMRHARRLNIRVTGIAETPDSTPEKDGQLLCMKLGYKEEHPLPFTKAWRAGKDSTRKRALILQFAGETERVTFMRKRVILRGLEGAPIFLDDDLTRMQLEHRRTCMPRVLHARREGKKAFYRDGRVIIDGRPMD